ncbi:alpha/beta fold hydrolase [Massilia endophytica]|uniref:alpha/beta fold hydrolase n=1 Tax=Massilia endophytica TaxID=2899220 RepID=UPI001E63356A|nr:alpha/beta fold hydrolase [Massilia endophytica]UGQ47063.1 alpha/beta hydrolase [Massilia endophytica]
MRKRFCLALPLLLGALAAQAAPGKSCHLPGTEETVRCVKVDVPLDYAQPGKTLGLHVTVAPAFREAARPDPLFVLAGGPGQAGSDYLAILNAAFRRVRATRDIVLIDQRGTGLSGRLDCKSPPEIDTMSEEQFEAELRKCIEKIAAPYHLYTTDAAARDIENVRRALGYGQINIWGGSYGTRLAQHYARLYPSSVRALVLDGVAAPDQVIPLGGHDAQAALETTFRQCEANAACARTFPALRTEFASLLASLAKAPVKVEMQDPRTAALRPVTISSQRFLGTVHRALYSQADARTLPFLIHGAYQGRWQPFVARSNRDSDYSVDGTMSGPLYLSVICAEDFPRMTQQLQDEDAKGSFMGSPQAQQLAKMCPLMKVKPIAPQQAAPIAAPVLMLSGAQDPVTPPRRAEAAGKSMQAAQHIVVQNGGHIVSMLGCVPRLMREFLDAPAKPLAAACIKEIPAPTFQLDSAGPQP